jgi:hypothetical protein
MGLPAEIGACDAPPPPGVDGAGVASAPEDGGPLGENVPPGP